MSAIKFYDFRLICVNAKIYWNHSVLIPFFGIGIVFFGIKLLHLFYYIKFYVMICEMKACTSN